MKFLIDVDQMLGVFANDIGIDLGTSTTLVYVKGQGVALCEPTVVAVDRYTNEVLAVGDEAKQMLGRTPGNIVAIRPMKDGVISDSDITEAMLRYFIRKVRKKVPLISPRVVIAVPSGITEVERRAVQDSAARAGARSPVLLVEEPIAAAIGVGLPIHEPTGHMIVDVGGGTTEIAVISMSGIGYSKTIRVGGDEYDELIVNYLRKNYNLVIGERTAEDVKIRIGSASALKEERTMEVTGRDMLAGLPKTIEISSEEVREALSEATSEILAAIRVTLERTPPELSADLISKGMVLTGGGALLEGLDRLISSETGLPVHVAEDPLTAVALGTGHYLSDLYLLKRLALNNNAQRHYAYDYAYS